MKPNTDRPLETELVEASFNNAYKEVMALGTAIESRQAGIESSLATIASDVGDVTALTTEDKDNLVEAINEVDAHADINANAISAEVSRATDVEGSLSNLSTSAKNNLVTAINEVDSHTDANASNISSLQSGKQDKLSTSQMNAVNSGITATDTAQIATNKENITALQSGKQDALSSAQLTATNSGIDSTKVAQIATNTDNISALSSGKVDKTTTVNGHALSGNVTVTKADVGLGNVANVGSSATPANAGTDNFTTGGAYTELAKKADLADTGNKADLETTAKTTLVAAINEVNTKVGTKAADDAVVKLTGDQTVSGVKTFSSAPKIPSLTTETPITSSAGVGYDENGNLIPITVGGGGGTVLPASADYIKTNAQGEAQKGTADTTVTAGSSALVTSGAVATALASKQGSLDSDQLAAVNSGINSTKVTTYDGYASQISGKQAALSEAQLAAVNSGINSTKVGQIATNADNIATLSSGKKDKQTAKSSPTSSGNTYQFIDTISQDANGVITATKKSVRTATTSQTGIVQLNDTSTSDSTTQAATAHALKVVAAAKQNKFATVISSQAEFSAWASSPGSANLVYILPGTYTVAGASIGVTEGTEHKVIGIGQVVITIQNLNITTGGLGLFNFFTGIENITFKCKLNGTVPGNLVLFKGCSNIKSCKVIFMNEYADFAVTVFDVCNNISKVDISSEATRWELSNINTNRMFSGCVGVEDCTAELVTPSYQGMYLAGMESCTRVRFCDMYLRTQGNTQPFPTKYSNSTPAKTYSSTYACADTPAGGFNA